MVVLTPPKFVKNLGLGQSSSPVITSEVETEETTITKLSVNEKSQIKIDCQITGLPKPAIKWLRNDDEIKTNEKYKFETKQDTYALLIKDCSFKEKGAYVVIAENSVGTVRNKIYIDINTIPSFVKPVSNTELVLEEKLQHEFEVTYKSKPKADVFWYFGDKSLKDGDEDSHYLISDEITNDEEGNEIFVSKLKIQNITLNDSGVYKCKLKNCAGEVNSNGTLAVLKVLL